MIGYLAAEFALLYLAGHFAADAWRGEHPGCWVLAAAFLGAGIHCAVEVNYRAAERRRRAGTPEGPSARSAE